VLRLHIIPYKPLRHCGAEELAAEQRARERRSQSGGVMFARKEEGDEKNAARKLILDLLTLDRMPHRISVLSMPGPRWAFEAKMLWQRDPHWHKQKKIKRTRFTCVENDRAIYYMAAAKIPGIKTCGVSSLTRPEYAEQAIGQGVIDRYIFANVDDLMQDPSEQFDVAWLDYTGPMTIERMEIVQQFWLSRVRSTLVVTSLKARWNRATSSKIARHGTCLDWMRATLPGHELHALEYQDGHSPMIQFAVAKEKKLASI
jgi:hypothetical protein